MFGYAGKILRINLSKNEIKSELLGKNLAEEFIGGSGFATSIFYNEVAAETPPLSPENKLVFAVGPLTGTIIPGSGRYVLVSKSPLTGLWGEGDSGGFWGPELKYAGYDVLIVEGASEKPVYLWICNGDTQIRDASHLWGIDTFITEKEICKDLGTEVQVASIGRAGENLVKLASIMHNQANAIGRSGLGAVMGSKKLKAIAVKGDQGVDVANIDKLIEMSKSLTDARYGTPIQKYGTGAGMEAGLLRRNLPIKNWGQNSWDVEEVKKLSANTIAEKCRTKMRGCFACPIATKKVVKIGSGCFAMEGPGPEYETLASLGSLCLNSDLESICKANDLCNRYGLDTIEMGTAIAWAMECYENQLITKKDTDDVDLTWGNGKAIVEMVEKTSKREGFGDILAEGVKGAAEKIGKGAENFAMHVKGSSLCMHDPRINPAQALKYSTLSMGAYHGKGCPGLPANTSIPDLINRQNIAEIADSLTICYFVGVAKTQSIGFAPQRTAEGELFQPEYYPDLVTASTGRQIDLKELIEIGEKIFTIKRTFITQLGVNRKDDKLPARFTNTPRVLDDGTEYRADVESMLPEYYKLRGWDKEGIPTKERLQELKIEFKKRD